ncbi:MAG: YqaE/Pmp3 family membrane protein [Deltaproteobacteria bacterium]|nr:YqaE/Pmp3 family membrane protein [Deltaproteobacteria bacterium]
MVLIIILCIIFPPLAAYLQVRLSTHFRVNILLTILGGVPGMVHALWHVFSDRKT